MADSFKNASGQAVPARGIIQITDALAIGRARVLKAVKPIDDDADKLLYYINGPTEIPNNKTGQASRGLHATWALFDSADGTPEFGEEWGPKDGSWKLRKGEKGFIIVGEPNGDDEVLVVQEFSSNDCPNNFRIVVVGNPTAGAFDMNLALPGGTDAITLNWDDTAAEVKTAIEGHAHWDADFEVDTGDGPFPMTSISIQLGGSLASQVIAALTISNITLSGGARSGVRVERACCEEAL